MFFRLFAILFAGSLLFTTLTFSATLAVEGRREEPWSADPLPEIGKGRVPESRIGPGQRAAAGLIEFFKNYISPVDGDRCPCYPTCSQYSLEAIRKHGTLVGVVMTFDRLIHESDEIRTAPLIKIYDSYRYFDPVENNDFWWDKKTGQR